MNVRNAVIAGPNKYSDLLSDAWQAHLKPKPSAAPTVVSLFAGCGGSSLGYSMAGFRELLAVEWDDNAATTFRLNFPDVALYHGDISELTASEVLRRTGLLPGELDVLDGSPPCQGFSTAGKRILDDPRNDLFREYVRLLQALRPKVLVMENVSGMVKGKMKLIFAEIVGQLKASGYVVKAWLLNSRYFDVPQSRPRMIFIGIRHDLHLVPTHPRPRSMHVTLRAALDGLRDHQQLSPTCSPLRVQRWRETRRGHAHQERFSLLRCDWNKVAPTILRVSGSGGHMHPDEPRLLHAGELMRIASFPDEFRFAGTWDHVVSRIGNSVPPLFMRAIADHVRTTVLDGMSAEDDA